MLYIWKFGYEQKSINNMSISKAGQCLSTQTTGRPTSWSHYLCTPIAPPAVRALNVQVPHEARIRGPDEATQATANSPGSSMWSVPLPAPRACALKLLSPRNSTAGGGLKRVLKMLRKRGLHILDCGGWYTSRGCLVMRCHRCGSTYACARC